MVSMVGFMVGGSFLALALNDLTWLTFALLAALDRWSRDACARKQVEAFQLAGTRGRLDAALATSRKVS
jgi:hypothetical protein